MPRTSNDIEPLKLGYPGERWHEYLSSMSSYVLDLPGNKRLRLFIENPDRVTVILWDHAKADSIFRRGGISLFLAICLAHELIKEHSHDRQPQRDL